MRKNINLILVLCFSLLLVILCWIYYLISHDVGEIKYDKTIDKSTFDICNDSRIFQYYSVNTSYKGGRKQLRKDLLSILNEPKVNLGSASGYITIRFVVNCNGDTGRYRIYSTNLDYKKVVFEKVELEKFKKAISQLKTWNPGRIRNNVAVDSYYNVNFKIYKGFIQDVF